MTSSSPGGAPARIGVKPLQYDYRIHEWGVNIGTYFRALKYVSARARRGGWWMIDIRSRTQATVSTDALYDCVSNLPVTTHPPRGVTAPEKSWAHCPVSRLSPSSASKRRSHLGLKKLVTRELKTEPVTIMDVCEATGNTARREVVCTRCERGIFVQVPVHGSFKSVVPWRPCRVVDCMKETDIRFRYDQLTAVKTWDPDSYFQMTGGVLWVSRSMWDVEVCIPNEYLKRG